MRKNILFIILVVLTAGWLLAGCTAPQPIVKIERVLVAPADNLLVACDVDPPPEKALYMKDISVGTVVPNSSVDSAGNLLIKDKNFYITQYARALKNTQEREGMLVETLAKNYQYQDVCNKRWQKLREWKAKATKELATPPPKGSK